MKKGFYEKYSFCVRVPIVSEFPEINFLIDPSRNISLQIARDKRSALEMSIRGFYKDRRKAGIICSKIYGVFVDLSTITFNMDEFYLGQFNGMLPFLIDKIMADEIVKNLGGNANEYSEVIEKYLESKKQ